MRNLVYLLLFIGLLSSCASKRTSSPSKYPSSTSQTSTSSSVRKPTSLTGLNYIERYKGIAIEEMEKYGIPASIKLAQALIVPRT